MANNDYDVLDCGNVGASLSGNQSISDATATKVQFDTEDWDIHGEYDPTTNYRFTPTAKAGKYLTITNIQFAANATGVRQVMIYKNGAAISNGVRLNTTATGTTNISLTEFVEMNGSTDYLEVFVYQSSGGALNVESASSDVRYQYLTP